MDREVVELYLDDIIPNRFQPREVFNEEALRELSASIKEHGVIQPIIVRKIGDKYEIIAGERRYKASTMAGLTKIPAIIRNMDDKEASKVALLENLQRKDLTAIEEARTYQKILELDSMTQEELGRTMGKSQAAIANKMRLLSLPDEIQEALLQDRISERHARSLLNLDTPQEQISMLQKIMKNRMTVRELDNEIRILKGNSSIPSEIVDNNITISTETKEIVNSQSVPNLKSKPEPSKIEELEDFDFIIPEPKKLVESNNEYIEELEKNDKNIIEAQVEDNPKTDFDKINELLRTTHTNKLSDTIDEIKGLVARLQNKGININIEELDFENNYEVIIKIQKDN